MKAKAEGYQWAALEYNDYGNAARCADLKTACEAEGLIFGIWMTRYFTPADCSAAVTDSKASFFIASPPRTPA